jgi:hypothetical protein
MRLIYINEIGVDYKNQKQYEFIFSDQTEFDIEEWYEIPASTYPDSLSPDLEYITLVGVLKNSDIDLDLIQKSDYFGIIDAVDGVISLGWEKFDYESEFERLTFSFGEDIESVNNKVENRGFKLIKEELKFNTGI